MLACRRFGLGLALLSLVAFAACGASSDDHSFDTKTDPTSGTGDGSSGSLGSSGGGADGGGTDTTCAATVSTASHAQVDIILLIDTSGSMSEETAQVQANINAFASSIGSSGLDYHVIMIAQKPFPIPIPIPLPTYAICVPPPLGGAACADNPPTFHHLDHTVFSNDSLDLILSTFPIYEPWLRPAAYKVFIEVTDDDSDLPWNTFDAQLLAKSPAQFGTTAARRYIFNSICGWKQGTAPLATDKCSTSENIGEQYQHLSQLTGGKIESVCATSYASVFGSIATGLVSKLGCEFAYPKSSSGAATDPAKVVVHYTPGSGGATKTLSQVTDASKCGSVSDAWYYDDNTNPTKILLCASTCAAVGADSSGKVEVAVGCKAPPPK